MLDNCSFINPLFFRSQYAQCRGKEGEALNFRCVSSHLPLTEPEDRILRKEYLRIELTFFSVAAFNVLLPAFNVCKAFGYKKCIWLRGFSWSVVTATKEFLQAPLPSFLSSSETSAAVPGSRPRGNSFS